jgi:hypothetical protein
MKKKDKICNEQLRELPESELWAHQTKIQCRLCLCQMNLKEQLQFKLEWKGLHCCSIPGCCCLHSFVEPTFHKLFIRSMLDTSASRQNLCHPYRQLACLFCLFSMIIYTASSWLIRKKLQK